jgi:peptidoglycan/xylan/chitin deacetylase (PgdA/CDA1 family)
MNRVEAKAVLNISFDVELAWGSVENGTWRQQEAEGLWVNTRNAVTRLLDIFHEAEIAATWGFVGKLLDQDGIKSDGLPPEYTELWRTNGKESSWRGIDLLERILASQMKHEIGCHSFFHFRYNRDVITRELVERDIELCREVSRKHGLSPVSFIFPANEERAIDFLAERGFTSFRGENKYERIRSTNPLIRRLISLSRLTGMGRLRIEKPSECSPGFLRLPGSVLFNIPLKRRRFLPGLVYRVKRGLKQAVYSQDYFHIWSHPANFAKTPSLLPALREILLDAVKMREAGQLEITTMGDSASKLGL